MNDLFEIVEDLKDIEAWGSDTNPAFAEIFQKWEERLAAAEDEAERQFESLAQLDRAAAF